MVKCFGSQQPNTLKMARKIRVAAAQIGAVHYSDERPKTLERMLDKGMVAQESAAGIQVYRPLLEKVGTLAAFARDFGQRVMEMEAPLAAAMFTGSKLVDADELARLDRLLHDWPEDTP